MAALQYKILIAAVVVGFILSVAVWGIVRDRGFSQESITGSDHILKRPPSLPNVPSGSNNSSGNDGPLALPSVTNVSVGHGPEGDAYSNAVGEVFVANSLSDTVSVFDTSTEAVVATISVGTQPTQVIFDPSNGMIYVLNIGSNTVSVIQPSSNSVIATATLPSQIYWGIYNPVNGGIYVLCLKSSGSDEIAKIAPTTYAVTTLSLGGFGSYILAYDPATLDLVVSDFLSNSVSIVNSTTNGVSTINLPLGTGPGFLVYNSVNKDMYIMDSCPLAGGGTTATGEVSVLGVSNSIIKTIAVGQTPITATVDPLTHEVYVVNYGNNASPMGQSTVSVISPANKVITQVAVGDGAVYATYDSADGDFFVPNEESASVSVLNASTHTVISTIAVVGGLPILGLQDSGSSDMLVISCPHSQPCALVVISSSIVVEGTLTIGYGPTGGGITATSAGDRYFTNPVSGTVSIVS
ncbi:MAG: YncE family protein [Thermoplasmata archaeon]